MASVHTHQLKDGTIRWRVMFRSDGRQEQATFDNPTGATEFQSLVERIGGVAAMQVLEARRGNTEAAPTLREFTARYLDPESGLLTGVEPGTRADYRKAADRSFLQILGDYPVNVISKPDVGRWLAWQETQPAARKRAGKAVPVAAKTIKNYHALLSSVLTAAVEEKHRTDNPAYRTRLPRGLKEEAVFLSVEEFATLLHFIPERHQPFILFLAGTGCRWGEATAATWADVNVHAIPATVRIDKAWKKGDGAPVLKHPKSSRSRRTVSITPDVVTALGTPGTGLLFPSQTGGHLWYGRFRTSVWERAVDAATSPEMCERAGMVTLSRRPTIHDLRHSHASWLIAAGVPLPYIQARLGHESITTTVNTYGHLVPDAHRQMADVVATTLAGVRPLRQLEE